MDYGKGITSHYITNTFINIKGYDSTILTDLQREDDHGFVVKSPYKDDDEFFKSIVDTNKYRDYTARKFDSIPFETDINTDSDTNYLSIAYNEGNKDNIVYGHNMSILGNILTLFKIGCMKAGVYTSHTDPKNDKLKLGDSSLSFVEELTRWHVKNIRGGFNKKTASSDYYHWHDDEVYKDARVNNGKQPLFDYLGTVTNLKNIRRLNGFGPDHTPTIRDEARSEQFIRNKPKMNIGSGIYKYGMYYLGENIEDKTLPYLGLKLSLPTNLKLLRIMENSKSIIFGVDRSFNTILNKKSLSWYGKTYDYSHDGVELKSVRQQNIQDADIETVRTSRWVTSVTLVPVLMSFPAPGSEPRPGHVPVDPAIPKLYDVHRNTTIDDFKNTIKSMLRLYDIITEISSYIYHDDFTKRINGVIDCRTVKKRYKNIDWMDISTDLGIPPEHEVFRTRYGVIPDATAINDIIRCMVQMSVIPNSDFHFLQFGNAMYSTFMEAKKIIMEKVCFWIGNFPTVTVFDIPDPHNPITEIHLREARLLRIVLNYYFYRIRKDKSPKDRQVIKEFTPSLKTLYGQMEMYNKNIPDMKLMYKKDLEKDREDIKNVYGIDISGIS